MKNHMRNVKTNQTTFETRFEKELLKLLNHEEILRNKGKADLCLDIAEYMPNLNKVFRQKLFKIWYNIRLVSFLQKNRLAKEKAINGDQDSSCSEKKKSTDKSESSYRNSREGLEQSKLSIPVYNLKRHSFLVENNKEVLSSQYIPKMECFPVEKPFRLKEVIKFRSVLKAITCDHLFPIYFETILRWDENYYEEYLSSINNQNNSSVGLRRGAGFVPGYSRSMSPTKSPLKSKNTQVMQQNTPLLLQNTPLLEQNTPSLQQNPSFQKQQTLFVNDDVI